MHPFAFAAALALLPAAPAPKPSPPPAPVPYGTVSVCAAMGSRPLAGPLTFTLAAPASAGGTQTVTVAIGACTQKIFYPSGTSLNVMENVPAGAAVTLISLAGVGSLTANAPASGSATMVLGSGDGILTFTTAGAAATPPVVDCKVPNVVGLSTTAAKALVRKRGCSVGLLHRKYSSAFRAGYVMGAAPHRGTVLAHGAPVDLVVSRGRRA